MKLLVETIEMSCYMPKFMHF